MPYHHISALERQLIERLKADGQTQADIARTLARSPSTISRELSRNGSSSGSGYDAEDADKQAKTRLHTPRIECRLMSEALRSEVLKCLDKKWSPVIIHEHLKASYSERPEMQISHESLYQWLYREAEAGNEHCRQLWWARPRRQMRSSRRPQHSRMPNRVDIEELPEVVEERSRIGDWEGDTVMSKRNKGGIATFVDRTSRFLLAAHVTDKRATTFSEASLEQFGWVPKSLCCTLTLDNGTEMADHARIGKLKEMDVYFAHPYAPWQRGANEQVNGMLRHYFPKGTDFSTVSPDRLQESVSLILID